MNPKERVCAVNLLEFIAVALGVYIVYSLGRKIGRYEGAEALRLKKKQNRPAGRQQQRPNRENNTVNVRDDSHPAVESEPEAWLTDPPE